MPFNVSHLTVAVGKHFDSGWVVLSLLKVNKDGGLRIAVCSFVWLSHIISNAADQILTVFRELCMSLVSWISKKCTAQEVSYNYRSNQNGHICPRCSTWSRGLLHHVTYLTYLMVPCFLYFRFIVLKRVVQHSTKYILTIFSFFSECYEIMYYSSISCQLCFELNAALSMLKCSQ